MEIYIDDVIGYYPNTEFWIRNKLKQAGGSDVIIKINSAGGDVFEGIAIYNAIREYAGKVEVVIFGMASSIASYIALAGDTLRVYDNSTFFIHNVWSLVVGDHNDLREQADLQERLSNLLAERYAQKSNKSIDEIKEAMNKETYYFGREIVEYGFADEIIETEDNTEQNKENAILTASKALEDIQAKFGNLKTKDAMFALQACIGECDVKKSKQGVKMADEKREPEQIDIEAIRAEAMQKERERIVAIDKIENPGIDSESFTQLKAEYKENGKSADELKMALYDRLVAQRKAEQEKLKAEKEKIAKDGKKLGELAGQLQIGTAGENELDDETKKASMAIEIAKQMTARR